MSRPATLAALKRLSRRKFDVNHIEDIMKQLFHESDRSAAIVAGTLVEDALRSAPIRKMPQLSKSDEDRIFDGLGPLSTFSAKIPIAHALDVIDTGSRQDIEKIKEIRNAFAHSFMEMIFQQKELADVCMQFRIIHLSPALPNLSSRAIFIVSCVALWTMPGKHVTGAYLGEIPISRMIAIASGET